MRGASNDRMVAMLRTINPRARIVVHAELLSQVDSLYKAGAAYVTIPRLLEARELVEVVRAAEANLLDEKRVHQEAELEGRDEIIP